MSAELVYGRGGRGCSSPHDWGGELLHSITRAGELVTVSVCVGCGVVRIHRRRGMRKPTARARAARPPEGQA